MMNGVQSTRELEGKIALIVGASSGVGRAAALVFARHGASVALAARRVAEGEAVAHEVEKAGGRAIFVRADVASASDVEGLVKTTVNTYGRLDCAFNNAAIEGKMQPIADYSQAQFDEVLQVNLTGVWLCMKYELRQMQAQDPTGGAIVNTASTAGLGGHPGGGVYSAAKAGVLALSKAAALENASSNIRVNALVIGAFDTPMLRRTRDVEQKARQVPLGRVGRPEEAAEAAAWLCSDRASYVIGHSMIVDGGVTATTR